MTLYVVESLESQRINMGDLRDQLKKIKNALGMSGAEKKSVTLETLSGQKTISLVIKRTSSETLPPTNSKTSTSEKKAPTSNRLQQTFKKKSQSTSEKKSTSTHSPQKSGRSLVTSSGVTITRSIAPSGLPKQVPVSVDASIEVPTNISSSVSLPPNTKIGQLALPKFTALTRTSEFKTPDSWVKHGISSQLNTHATGHRLDIYIGLDFGTAFTKAAVQFLDKIYPVDWNGVANLQKKYLLPTEYSEIPNNQCFLGQHPSSTPEKLYANLKREFIFTNVSSDSLAKASVFLALVLQYVRAWVYQHHAPKLGSALIGWYLNIGIPSDVLDKNKRSQTYTKMANIAWVLSLKPQSEITYERALEVLSKPAEKVADLREVAAVPELVAQLAGYSKSASKQKGLHILVDIGGGTVDMVTFNIHEANGDDVFPFFVANVKPLGSYAFLENRFHKFPIQASSLGSDIQKIITETAFSKFSGIPVRSIQEVDMDFLKKIQHEFEAVLNTTHKRRYPSSPYWRDGIRTFISGGGAFIQGYQDAIRNSIRPQNCPLITMELPPHPRVVKIQEHRANYSRISVACGLTFDSDSLGSIRPASEVKDASPLIITVNGLPMRERPDRDDLYPK